jgi:hypothetical protein
VQRIKVREFLQECGLTVPGGEEALGVATVLDELTALAGTAGGEPPLPEPPSVRELKELRNQQGNTRIILAFGQLQDLRAKRRDWLSRRKVIEQRLPAWRDLQALLQHGSSLPEVEDIAHQADAIRLGRQLLDEPDPAAPLLAQATSRLRDAVTAAWRRANDAYQAAVKSLDLSPAWHKMDGPDQDRLIKESGLIHPASLDIGSTRSLIATLEQAPLSTWDDRAAAVPERLTQTLVLAAKVTEPKAVGFRPPSAEIKTPEDVERYVAELKTELLKRINIGPVVI